MSIPAFEKYKRDGRSPLPEKESTSKVMSANRAKNTKPEVKLRKGLWALGVRGYRLHWKKASGRPDIAFPSAKVAVFVHGCFWHRCPTCQLPSPKTHSSFWNDKFSKNIERDKRKSTQLQDEGWAVLTIWECDITNNLSASIQKITSALSLRDRVTK